MDTTQTFSVAPGGHARSATRAGWSGALHLPRLLLRLASLTACVLLWEWASVRHADFGLVTFRNIPAPHEVLRAIWDLIHSSRLGTDLLASTLRVFSGFAAAAAAGIVLGLIIGRSARLKDVLLPPLEVLRPIPAVAWIPLAILMFPSSELSMVFITFTGALFPILLSTVHGAEHVDARLIASARSLGAGRRAIFAEVVLPGAAPAIVTGLSIGMGTAWFCLVTAEMISGQFGIGYYTWASYTVQDYTDIVVGMLFIGLFGMGSSALISALGRMLMPWQRREGKPV